jgi:hypothetical protein
MYLRFVVADIDENSERALGVFHAVRYLRDAGKLYAYEEDQHDMVRWWFNENLESQLALQLPSPRSIERRTRQSLGSSTLRLST